MNTSLKPVIDELDGGAMMCDREIEALNAEIRDARNRIDACEMQKDGWIKKALSYREAARLLRRM